MQIPRYILIWIVYIAIIFLTLFCLYINLIFGKSTNSIVVKVNPNLIHNPNPNPNLNSIPIPAPIPASIPTPATTTIPTAIPSPSPKSSLSPKGWSYRYIRVVSHTKE